MVRLGVNIDHVATVRQARGEFFPDPIEAAKMAVSAGAQGITAHLREDRRHIQDADLFRLKKELKVPLNMEMACTNEIVGIACKLRPTWVCLVPEKRKELTTEGGLDLKNNFKVIQAAIKRLRSRSIRISLFIDPRMDLVRLAKALNADAVEFHTGTYARLFGAKDLGLKSELKRIGTAANSAQEAGLIVNAGHGIDYENVGSLLEIFDFHELNIGFSIVARAIFVGIGQAVKEMKRKLR